MKKMLHTKAVVLKESVQKTEGILDAVVGSSEVLDRAGDSISQSGWQITTYKKTNPVILWGHNVKEERPPIGKALKTWVADKGEKTSKLMFKVQFDLQDTFASEIFRKVKDGFINTVSVGFKPLEWELFEEDNPYSGRKYLKQELLELSFVPVPANPEAVVALKGMKDKRFDPMKLEELYPEAKKKKVKEATEEPEAEEAVEKPDTEEVPEKPEAEVVPEKPETEEAVEEVTEETPEETPEEEVSEEETPEEAPEETPKEEVEKPVVEETKKKKKTTINKVKEKIKKKIKPKKVKKKKKKKKKKVLPYKDLETLPESAPWDGPGQVAKAEVSDLKLMCTWYDSEKPDVKSSYKLPHHMAEGHKTVWRGVASAMAALLGARGGVTIPDNDRKGVYNHLKKHYKAFDKDVPDFKAVEEQVLKHYDEEIHALILDREDKYMIRLVKKVLAGQQQAKKKKKKKTTKKGYTSEQVKSALEVLDLALSHALKGSEDGGE
jgi:HK97 family phage prohead protease